MSLTLVLPHLWPTPKMTALMKAETGGAGVEPSKGRWNINTTLALKIKSEAWSPAVQFASKKRVCVHLEKKKSLKE